MGTFGDMSIADSLRRHGIAALVIVIAGVSGCGEDDAHTCTNEARPSVNATVLAPDGSNAVDATVSIVTPSGERRPCAGPFGEEASFGCYDGVGTKVVEGRQGDLTAEVEVSVPWSADGCQPVPQFAVIRLTE